jgi:hypothetical protein
LSRSRVTAVNFVLQATPEEKISRIVIRWKCWSNITADNYVDEDIGQNLHRYTCRVDSSRVFLTPPYSLSSSVNSEKNCPRMTCSLHIFRN